MPSPHSFSLDPPDAGRETGQSPPDHGLAERAEVRETACFCLGASPLAAYNSGAKRRPVANKNRRPASVPIGQRQFPGADVRFDHSPNFNFNDDKVKFDTNHIANANDNYGSPSGFVPKFLSIGKGVLMTPFLLRRMPLNESNRRAFSRFRQ